jgi:hypothetical protein
VNLVDVAVVAGLLLLAMWAMFTRVDSDVFDLEDKLSCLSEEPREL